MRSLGLELGLGLGLGLGLVRVGASASGSATGRECATASASPPPARSGATRRLTSRAWPVSTATSQPPEGANARPCVRGRSMWLALEMKVRVLGPPV